MPEIKKLVLDDPDTKSADLVAGNIETLKALFPEAFTEGKIDFDVLRQLLGGAVDEKDEKYGLNWHGKRKARQLALTPSTGTLLPCPDESVDWDTTKNLMIEGDNLEVLKLLQKSYTDKIKFIYIDPPYNTGSDLIYQDDFADNIKNYLELTGQVENSRPLTSNSESNGRFHTNWLNMMFPRLKLARALLKEDGVMMLNVGAKEIANARLLLDNIFGEENFIANISRVMKTGGAKGRFFTPNVDYVLVYAKNIEITPYFRTKIKQSQIDNYYNKIQSGGPRDGERYGEERLYLASLTPRPNQRYWIKCPDGSFVIPPGESFPATIAEGEKIRPTNADGCWRWTYDSYKIARDADRIIFKETTTSALVDENAKPSKYNLYFKLWLSDQQEKGKVPADFIGEYENRQSSAELKGLGIEFDFAKPSALMAYLVDIVGLSDGDIVLDFFAGSGSTAHGVLRANVEDGIARRYILVQLPEKIESNTYKSMFDLTCDRVRRTGEQLRAVAGSELKFRNNIDTGYRVFKLSSSNIRTWDPNPSDIEDSLLKNAEHIIHGRKETDVLYELLLKLGLDLCVPIEKKDIAGKAVHSIGGGTLIVCLADGLTKDSVEAVANGIVAWWKELAPAVDTRVVFKDSGFADDVAKTNMAAILNQNGILDVRSL